MPDAPPGNGVPASPTVGSRTSKRCRRRHSCLSPGVGWPKLSRDGRLEGSQPAVAGGPGAGWLNPYPSDYRTAFASSLIPYPSSRRLALRHAVPRPGQGSAGRRRAYHVPSLSPCGLGRAFSPVVRVSAPRDKIARGLDHVPCWPQRVSIFRLLDRTTFSSASPGLTVPHHPGARPRCCWESRGGLTSCPAIRRMRLRCPGSFRPRSCLRCRSR